MMCMGMFMAILDVKVVATSLPTIQAALSVPADQMSWIQTAYLIAEVIAIPLTGFLTRWIGMRWLFVGGVLAFTLASAGCAMSNGFGQLIALRVLQGFSGGVLIPAVFSAVFLLFPQKRQGLATTIAGVLAVLAPTVGPVAGGWITETYTWRWLFLINLVPGLLAACGAFLLLPRERVAAGLWRSLDILALVLMAVSLASLEIALKEAPGRGWISVPVFGLMGLSILAASGFLRRTLASERPVVDLRTFRDRNFAFGALLSFALGMGLFGSVYLMPVFLALVRGHHALRIGEIMLVTGAVQLLTAPIAVALERRFDARWLAGIGFLMFSLGLGMSAFETRQTDFSDMFWPQVIRGAAIMLCLLPPTRLALGQLSAEAIPDASGLFNLMRNLGGAIGLALIDTIIFGRAPHHAAAIISRLQNGDLATAEALGIPIEVFKLRLAGPIDPGTAELLMPLIKTQSLVQAINEAWWFLAIATLIPLLVLPFFRPVQPGVAAEAGRSPSA